MPRLLFAGDVVAFPRRHVRARALRRCSSRSSARGDVAATAARVATRLARRCAALHTARGSRSSSGGSPRTPTRGSSRALRLRRLLFVRRAATTMPPPQPPPRVAAPEPEPVRHKDASGRRCWRPALMQTPTPAPVANAVQLRHQHRRHGWSGRGRPPVTPRWLGQDNRGLIINARRVHARASAARREAHVFCGALDVHRGAVKGCGCHSFYSPGFGATPGVCL